MKSNKDSPLHVSVPLHVVSKPCVAIRLVNGEHELYQGGARLDRIHGFGNSEQSVDFGAWIGDGSGEQFETETGAIEVAYDDAWMESPADFVAARMRNTNLHYQEKH